MKDCITWPVHCAQASTTTSLRRGRFSRKFFAPNSLCKSLALNFYYRVSLGAFLAKKNCLIGFSVDLRWLKTRNAPTDVLAFQSIVNRYGTPCISSCCFIEWKSWAYFPFHIINISMIKKMHYSDHYFLTFPNFQFGTYYGKTIKEKEFAPRGTVIFFQR